MVETAWNGEAASWASGIALCFRRRAYISDR